MFNYVVILTDAFASGYSVKAAARLAKISEAEAQKFFDENGDVIDERRQDIKQKYAIVNPVTRIEMLNRVALMGLEGYEVLGKGGLPTLIQNPSVSVAAIKAYSEMEERLSAGISNTSTHNSEQEKIIRSLFDELRAELGLEQAADVIKADFPDYKELVDELLLKTQ